MSQESLMHIKGPSSYWQNFSFADGFAGIAYFYAAMDQAFPGENYGKIAQEHLLEALRAFQNHKPVNSSLFKGLAGLSLAMSAVSEPSDHFRQFHAGIDEWLIEDVNRFYIKVIPSFLDESILIPPFLYALPSGLSGIIVYLISRKDNPYLHELAQKSADELAKLMLTKKRVREGEVSGWYFTQDQLMEAYRSPGVEGGYNTSMLFGVTGCLQALAAAAIEGFRSERIYQAIEAIALWLLDTYQYTSENCYWNAVISAEGKTTRLPVESEGLQNSWLYGWPSVVKSLFLAGQALDRDDLISFSRTLCIQFTEKEITFFSGESSFCLGSAGFISVIYPLAKAMKDGKLLHKVRKITADIARSFDFNSPFGFTQHSFDANQEFFPINSATIASGAAGIGLSLLLTEDKWNFSL